MKNRAFTLSEVLITLGVIGVVAALTLPPLISANKAHRLRSQFLKTYSTLKQVFLLMEEDGVVYDPGAYYDSPNSYYKIFGSYLAGATDCGTSTGVLFGNGSASCYNAPRWYDNGKHYKTIIGDRNIDTAMLAYGQWLLQDGALILFYITNKWHPVYISIDVNGYKSPPNRWGYDLFTFQYVDGEFIAVGEKGTGFADMDKYCNFENSADDHNGVACTAKAISNADYFKHLVKNVK